MQPTKLQCFSWTKSTYYGGGALPIEYDAGTATYKNVVGLTLMEGRPLAARLTKLYIVERDDPGESQPHTSGHVAEIDGRRSRRPRSEDLR